MKLIFWTMCFCAMAVTFSNARDQYMCHGLDLNDEEFMEFFLTIVPVLKSDYCMYECMLSAAGMVSKDGMIDPEKFVVFHINKKKYDHQTLTKITIVTVACKKHRHSSGNICYTIANLVDCSVKKAKECDLPVETMLTALRDPFFSMDIKQKLKYFFSRYG